jgi:hypothetical protein
MSELYNIYYKGDWQNPRSYEVTTDNFEKWLKWHNEERVSEGNEPEDKSDFVVEPVYVQYFN